MSGCLHLLSLGELRLYELPQLIEVSRRLVQQALRGQGQLGETGPDHERDAGSSVGD